MGGLLVAGVGSVLEWTGSPLGRLLTSGYQSCCGSRATSRSHGRQERPTCCSNRRHLLRGCGDAASTGAGLGGCGVRRVDRLPGEAEHLDRDPGCEAAHRAAPTRRQ